MLDICQLLYFRTLQILKNGTSQKHQRKPDRNKLQFSSKPISKLIFTGEKNSLYSTRQIIVFCVAGLFLFGWIRIIIYLNSIPGKLLAHPHEAGGGSSSFYSHSVSHLKISTLFAHQQSQKPFRQILNQIKYSNNLQVIIIGDQHSLREFLHWGWHPTECQPLSGLIFKYIQLSPFNVWNSLDLNVSEHSIHNQHCYLWDIPQTIDTF